MYLIQKLHLAYFHSNIINILLGKTNKKHFKITQCDIVLLANSSNER
jgi:hypothetical protein